MKYDAFISYRHAPLDMEIAKKLHKGLETFPIPLPVQKKTGKKKIRRVFRDQEELPIGSDLTEKISSAIAESEYLIVVCSKDTPGSYWVQKEIETFIKMHDRSHALAILVDGEPGESFPEMLLTDENGNPVEPLAADVRGETRSERDKKFKTELLRLAAPIIGCSFDDLRQRHRERIVRKVVGIVAGTAALIAAAGISFGLYNANVAKEMEMLANEKAALAEEKTQLANDILAEYNDKLMNQSRFYASESLTLLNNGDRRAAAFVAAEGIPSETNERPYVPDAEYSLSEALHVYDIGKQIAFNKLLPHEMTLFSIQKSENGRYISTVDSGGNVYVWDSQTWDRLAYITPRVADNNYRLDIRQADADDEGVYIQGTDFFGKYDYEGNEIYEITDGGSSILNATVRPEEGIVILTDASAVRVLDSKTGVVLSGYEADIEESFSKRNAYDPERNLFVCGHGDLAVGRARISFIDLDTGEVTEAEASNDHIIRVNTVSSGNIVVLSSNIATDSTDYFREVNMDLYTADGEHLWGQELEIPFRNTFTASFYLKSHTYDVDGEQKTRIVLGVENNVFSYAEEDGSLVSHTVLPGDMQSMLVLLYQRFGYVGYANGNVDLVDMEAGTIMSDYSFSTVYGMTDMLPVGEGYVFYTAFSSDAYVMEKVPAYDVEEIRKLDTTYYCNGVSENGDYFVLSDLDGNFLFMDKDGNEIYRVEGIDGYQKSTEFYGDLMYLILRDELYIIDPKAKTKERISYQELGVDSELSGLDVTPDGAYACGWYIDHLYVLDLKNRSCVRDVDFGKTLGRAIIADNGQTVYYALNEGKLNILNVSDGSTEDLSAQGLHQVANAFRNNCFVLSPDNTLLAMSCSDGYVRILDTASKTVTQMIPLLACDDIYIEFLDGGRRLLLQGDDTRVRIWGVEEGAFVNSYEFYQRLLFTIPAYDKGHIAFCTGSDLTLVETTGYVQIADVPYGVAYIPENECFFHRANGMLYRTYYKDCNALLTELERQFPGDALTENERTQYNLN